MVKKSVLSNSKKEEILLVPPLSAYYSNGFGIESFQNTTMAANYPWKMFDRNPTTFWYGGGVTLEGTYMQISMPFQCILTRVVLQGRNVNEHGFPSALRIKGSNNGHDFETIRYESGIPTNAGAFMKKYEIDLEGDPDALPYSIYKFEIVSWNKVIVIGEMELYGYRFVDQPVFFEKVMEENLYTEPTTNQRIVFTETGRLFVSRNDSSLLEVCNNSGVIKRGEINW